MEISRRNIRAYNKVVGKKRGRKNNESSFLFQGDFTSRPSLLQSAYNTWNSLSQWREDIRRNERFVYGDQWTDMVYDAKSKCRKTERQILQEQGLNPSQYNIIRNIIRTIVGFWANNKSIPNCVAQKDENQKESEILTATLHTLYRKNELWKLDMAQITQILITGLAVVKSHYANRDGYNDVVSDYIDPFGFFVDNSMRDPRYTDCSLVGCLHDLSVDDVVGLFANGSRKRANQIRGVYGNVDRERIHSFVETFTDERLEQDFFVPPVEKEGLVRVIEVWRKESAECFDVHDYLHGTNWDEFDLTENQLKAINRERIEEYKKEGVADEDMLLLKWEWRRSNYWKYYYLTPSGQVLDEGVSPFWHGKHPFTFEIHEFFIGKIYPFITDIIDANKQINKLSAISELLTKNSAKSTLFYPKQSLENTDETIESIEAKVTEYESVIVYDAKGGAPPPTYVNTVAQAFTPLNVVNMYLKLSEQVSGVHGALQGQQPPAGTPAQSFLQQSQNSATSLVALFESINSFRTRRDKKNVQLMQQFYEGRRYVYDKNKGQELVYNADEVKHIDVDISVVENTNTPAYRMMMNDVLMQLKQYDVENKLDLKGLIEVGNFPFKDDLLDYLNKREQEIQQIQQGQMQGQVLTPMPQELQQQLAQTQFSPEVQQQLAQLPESVKQYAMDSVKSS